MSFSIDINCDMGESFGRYTVGNDDQIIPYITSANIACGLHAGDAHTIDKTVQLAAAHGVKIGAHPGLPDLAGFGRRMMQITAQEAYQLTIYQVGALQGFVKAHGAQLHHVKPHGALYHLAAKDSSIAVAIAEAISALDCDITLYGLANSQLITAAEKVGIPVAQEVFADRTYQADGTLTPRTEKQAVIESEAQAITQALQLVKEQQVTTTTGKTIPIKADTLCIHGDHPNALAFARQLHQALKI